MEWLKNIGSRILCWVEVIYVLFKFGKDTYEMCKPIIKDITISWKNTMIKIKETLQKEETQKMVNDIDKDKEND